MTIARRALLASAAASATMGTGLGGLPWRSARAQAANTIRIGVLADMSGMYRDVTGPTSVACTRLAASMRWWMSVPPPWRSRSTRWCARRTR